MENTLIGLYERTIKNCRYYEKEGKILHLNNEIGVLRGIAYCMEIAGECPHSDEFLHYINMQNKLVGSEVI